MKHFTDEAWIDFVRRILPPSSMGVMQAHLDEGCETCGKRCHIWQTVAAAVSREVRHEPPESVVRLAKTLCSASRHPYIVPRHAKMAPQVFDSFHAPAVAAGVRSVSSAPRHLLHRLGPWTIDLRMESQGGRRMCVAGQILRAVREQSEPFTAEVIVVRDDTLVAQGPANQFGEFLLECEHGANLRVYFDIAGRRPIGIALPDPDA